MSDEVDLTTLSFEQLLERLNVREQRFVQLYDGNGVDACRKAEYKGNAATLGVQAHRLMRKPEVKLAIQKRTQVDLERFILTREERQELWSRTALNEDVPMGERLKASELLGKSQADFTERLEVKGELTLAELVRESMGKS